MAGEPGLLSEIPSWSKGLRFQRFLLPHPIMLVP